MSSCAPAVPVVEVPASPGSGERGDEPDEQGNPWRSAQKRVSQMRQTSNALKRAANRGRSRSIQMAPPVKIPWYLLSGSGTFRAPRARAAPPRMRCALRR